MYVGLRVKDPLFLTYFNETWIFSTYFRKKTWNIKFNQNPSGGSRVVPCGLTDMTKLLVAFRNLRTRLKKILRQTTRWTLRNTCGCLTYVEGPNGDRLLVQQLGCHQIARDVFPCTEKTSWRLQSSWMWHYIVGRVFSDVSMNRVRRVVVIVGQLYSEDDGATIFWNLRNCPLDYTVSR